MLIPAWAWRALLDADVRLDAVDDNTADVWVSPNAGKPFQVELKTYGPGGVPLRPATVRQLAASGRDREPAIQPMVIASTPLSDETIQELKDSGWSWLAVTTEGSAQGVIRQPGGAEVRIGPRDRPPEPRAAKPGQVGYGAFAVIRTLLSNGQPRSQTELADAAGISQPRVSQVLKELDTSLVGRFNRSHWVATDWNALLDRFLLTYPGPGGIATHWYGLESIGDQARAAVSVLERSAYNDAAHAATARGAVVSGDVAADVLAAWRRPQAAILYATRGSDLAEIGFTPSGPDEATLTLVVPKDRSVWPSDRDLTFSSGDLPLANGIQVLWDVWIQRTTDSDQAADRIRARLLHDFQHDLQQW